MMADATQWAPALSGLKVSDYELDSKPLGSGGFGLVFAGTNSCNGTVNAIKILVPNSPIEDQTDFDNEGLLLQKFSGSMNVVQLAGESGQFDIPMSVTGADGSSFTIQASIKFHVLEIANGGLDRYLASRDLSWVEILTLWRDIVCGVHQMHLKSVAHRDLKSSNCLMFKKPKVREIVKISDLGRSRDLSVPGRYAPADYAQGRGDLSYAPPEFIFIQGLDTERGHLDADLYGIGSILYEIITGVSLTRHIFPNLGVVLRASLQDSAQGRFVDLSSLRSHIESTIRVLGDDIPRIVRDRILGLLLTLCDPVPKERRKAEGPRGKVPRNSLESIIRQIDIAIRQLKVEAASQPRLATRRGA